MSDLKALWKMRKRGVDGSGFMEFSQLSDGDYYLQIDWNNGETPWTVLACDKRGARSVAKFLRKVADKLDGTADRETEMQDE